MKPIVIIPARGGSKRVPRKNIVDLNGSPLITYAIATCLKSDLFSKVIVSTEDMEIADIARQYGATVDARPTELAGDKVSASRVCKELLQRCYDSENYPEMFCMVYAMAAFLTPNDLIESAALLKDCDCVMGVSSYPIHPYKAMVEENGGLRPLWPEENSKQSQNYPDTVASNGTFCWLRTNVFLKNENFYPSNLKGFVIPLDRAVDIDTPADLELARELMRKKTLNLMPL